jgi:hypothetical protein
VDGISVITKTKEVIYVNAQQKLICNLMPHYQIKNLKLKTLKKKKKKTLKNWKGWPPSHPKGPTPILSFNKFLIFKETYCHMSPHHLPVCTSIKFMEEIWTERLSSFLAISEVPPFTI